MSPSYCSGFSTFTFIRTPLNCTVGPSRPASNSAVRFVNSYIWAWARLSARRCSAATRSCCSPRARISSSFRRPKCLEILFHLCVALGHLLRFCLVHNNSAFGICHCSSCMTTARQVDVRVPRPAPKPL